MTRTLNVVRAQAPDNPFLQIDCDAAGLLPDRAVRVSAVRFPGAPGGVAPFLEIPTSPTRVDDSGMGGQSVVTWSAGQLDGATLILPPGATLTIQAHCPCPLTAYGSGVWVAAELVDARYTTRPPEPPQPQPYGIRLLRYWYQGLDGHDRLEWRRSDAIDERISSRAYLPVHHREFPSKLSNLQFPPPPYNDIIYGKRAWNSPLLSRRDTERSADWSASAIVLGPHRDGGPYSFWYQGPQTEGKRRVPGRIGVSFQPKMAKDEEDELRLPLAADRFPLRGDETLRLSGRFMLAVLPAPPPAPDGDRENALNRTEWTAALLWTSDRNRPDGDDGTVVSPGRFWRRWVEALHLVGVRTFRGGRPISMVPMLDEAFDGIPGRWWLRYRVRVADGEPIRTEFDALVGPAGTVAVDAVFPLLVDRAGAPLRRRVSVFFIDTDPWLPRHWNGGLRAPGQAQALQMHLRDALLDGTLPAGTPPTGAAGAQTVHLGALDLRFPASPPDGKAVDATGRCVVSLAPRGTYLGDRPTALLDLRWHLAVEHAEFGDQDPELGMEALTTALKRDRPITIPLMDEPPIQGPLLLRVREATALDTSRSLEMTLAAVAAQPNVPSTLDAVVLDSQPFSIARVVADLEAADADGVVAVYREAQDLPGSWELKTSTSRVALLLPPQIVGETMIKGAEGLTPGEPFDFRLSPPARVLLRGAEFTVARSIAPWNLRRLLGPQRLGGAGALVDALDLELLYGMPFFAKDPMVRLAEIESLVGRMPVSQEILDLADAQPAGDGDAEALRIAAAKAYRRWFTTLLARSATWPVYARFGDRSTILLKDGVEHRFRSTRDCADPFQPDQRATARSDQGAPPSTRPPLRGGVDWGFESEKVYDEVLSTAARSVESRVSGLMLAPLGGSGAQQAVYAGGKSIIASVASNGRDTTITIVRVGRISRLYNTAKHVIEYSRTMRRPERYRAEQPDGFDGLAALRKVREYIQITQPQRAYPDLAVEETPPGSLLECAFETIEIEVRTRWGYDVADGFIMPLWGPAEGLTPEEHARFYPKPRILLKLARAPEKGGGGVWQSASDPGELCFFSSTRREDGGDPDQWPSFPDVDRPLRAEPKVPALDAMAPGDRSATMPPPPAEHPGLERFTITLDRVEEAVDLVHGRAGKAVEARLDNIVLVRARPARRDPGPVEADLDSGAEAMSVGIDRLAQIDGLMLRALAAKPDATVADVAGDLNALLDKVRANLEAVTTITGRQDGLKRVIIDWKAEQAALAQRWNARLGQEIDEAKAAVLEELAETGGEVGHLRARLRRLAEEHCTRMRASVQALDSAPERLVVAVDAALRVAEQRLDEADGAVSAAIDGELRRWEAELGRLDAANKALFVARVTATRKALHQTVRDAAQRMDAVLAQIEGGVIRRVPRLANVVAGGGVTLAETVRRLRTDVLGLAAALDTEIDGRLGALDEPSAIATVFEALWTAIDTLRRSATGSATRLKETVRTTLTGFRNHVLGLAKTGGRSIAALRDDADARIETACGTLLAVIDGIAVPDDARQAALAFFDAVTEQKDTLLSEIAAAVDGAVAGGILGDVARNADTIVSDLAGTMDELSQYLEALKAGTERLDAARRELTTRARAVEEAWRPVTALVEEAVRAEYLTKGTLPERLDNTMRMLRAFGDAPVAQALEVTRDKLGYYLDALTSAVNVTPAAAVFNRASDRTLSALSICQPFNALAERLVPAGLSGMRLGDLLPRFGGLDLSHLLPSVPVPDEGPLPKWIQISHGFDKHALKAWAVCEIHKDLTGKPSLFDFGPVSMTIGTPRFDAHSRIEVTANGTAQSVNAVLAGDWAVTLGGQTVLTIEKARLVYDNSGKLTFDVKAQNFRLAPALDFLSNLLSKAAPGDSGVIIAALPNGVGARINLPLPDLTAGAFSITGLQLSSYLDLLIDDGFTIATGLWLAKPTRPFNLSILCLGGGGWFGVDVFHRPPRALTTRLSIGVSAGATLAINLAVASGVASVQFQVSAEYSTDGDVTTGPAIRIGLLAFGELRVLGVASIYLAVGFDVVYEPDSGSLVGTGWLTASIRICWCVTISVSRQVNMTFAKGRTDRSAGAASVRAVSTEDAVRRHLATLIFDELE
ncbi:hypothetical protein [Azospirillum sp.]|uniref:hypothetical protein n=1 Tax=Azospirillum sp. TaxID=34012 RepID=UPI002D25A434|nr:hypothetical protein [Azospirillum sp.]HYF85016.1 hypothetical protein [Azospirillum sp.]